MKIPNSKSQIPNKFQISNPKSQNNVERVFSESDSCADYARRYLSYLSEVFRRVDARQIQKFADLLDQARVDGRQIFFMGNGGSAATSSHFANDLSKGARVKGKRPFRAMSLADNVSLVTALANDEGYDRIFVSQLENILNKGDVVVGISASGNSPNIVKAVEYANSVGAVTVGLTGFSGGRLKEIAKSCVHVETPKGEYGPVEDIHMILDHLVTTYLKMKIEKQSADGDR